MRRRGKGTKAEGTEGMVRMNADCRLWIAETEIRMWKDENKMHNGIRQKGEG